MSSHERKQAIDEEKINTLVKAIVSSQFTERPEPCIRDLYGHVMEQIQLPLLRVALTHSGNNKSKAASWLGISRNTLRQKLKLYDFTG